MCAIKEQIFFVCISNFLLLPITSLLNEPNQGRLHFTAKYPINLQVKYIFQKTKSCSTLNNQCFLFESLKCYCSAVNYYFPRLHRRPLTFGRKQKITNAIIIYQKGQELLFSLLTASSQVVFKI